MRQNYFKNAALLTGSDVVLRLAGMGLRIWLANALGGAGMGLYQLVLAVYGLFVTLATAGISVAATRLLTEELSRDKAAARGMLVRLVLAGLTLGGLAMVAQLATAGLAAKWWLGDVRAAAALRTSALGLPWMAISAVLRGFFLARRRVEPNVLSQLAEQTVRIAAVVWALSRTQSWPDGSRCALVLAATALSEAVSTALMALFYRREAARLSCGISGGFRWAHRRAGAVRYLKGYGTAAAQFPLWAAGQSGGFADAGDHTGAYRGTDRPAERTAGPDAAAHGVFLRAGGHAVLGVGQAAGAAALP